MAFRRDLRRTLCNDLEGTRCGCHLMTDEDKIDAIVFDAQVWAWLWGETPALPRGIIYKFPSTWGRWGRSSEMPEPPSLHELSFKVVSILTENVVRHSFCTDNQRNTIHWHWPEYLMAKEMLVRNFSFPEKFASATLPKLQTSTRWPHHYPDEILAGIFDNTCDDHKDANFDVYYNLLC